MTSYARYVNTATLLWLADGKLEFLFVLDSAEDSAYKAISALLSEMKGPIARILVASQASTSSQKIHK